MPHFSPLLGEVGILTFYLNPNKSKETNWKLVSKKESNFHQ